MAHLWLPDGDNWATMPLDGAAYVVETALPPRRLDRATSLIGDPSGVLLRRVGEDLESNWVLLARPGSAVDINGLPVGLGIARLADRDEIRVSSAGSFFFSTERLAEVEPFPELGPAGYCPRCKQAIGRGTPAVRCPGCALFHHQSEDLGCWTYGPTCAACSCDSAPDAGFRWTPEDL